MNAPRLREALAALPDVIPLPVTVIPAMHGHSIHKLPADPSGDVMTIDQVFSGRALITSFEMLESGWCFVIRDIDRRDMHTARARRTVAVPIRAIPDLAEAIAEAMQRTVALYGMGFADEPNAEAAA